MNTKMGRNDPCLCGSGKKYKKCCGKQDVLSISSLVDQDILQQFEHIIDFTLNRYGFDLDRHFEAVFETLFDIDELASENEELMMFLSNIHTMWGALYLPNPSEQTPLQVYIGDKANKLERVKVKNVIQSWTSPEAIAGTVIGVDGKMVYVKSLLNNETMTIKILGDRIPEKDSFITGLILPYDDHFILFWDKFIDFVEEVPDFYEEILLNLHSESSKDLQQYFTENYLEVIYHLLMSMDTPVDVDDFYWQSKNEYLVAFGIKNILTEMDSMKVIPIALKFWHQYCQIAVPQIGKIESYIAGMFYLLMKDRYINVSMTQKEVAERFNVSKTTVSTRYKELDDILEEALMNDRLDIDSQLDFMYGEDDDIYSPKMKAMELVGAAFESVNPLRKKLLNDALKIYPNLPDAYIMLAEDANKDKEKLALYQKAVMVGRLELGEHFFQEHKDNLWYAHEARPYMRAKYELGQFYTRTGLLPKAIGEYEELLKLNIHDNQGVRYELFPVYIETEEFNKAKKLANQFPEDSTFWLYHQLLLELAEHGGTEKAIELYRGAIRENANVPSFLLRRKKQPKEEPLFYQPGDETEAVLYVNISMRTWESVDGALTWLNEQLFTVKG